MSLFAINPKQYVEKNYKDRAVLFTEDTEDWLDQKSVNSRSPIVFYNSTSEDIEFEFHELKTKFNQVKKDVVRKIKGRDVVKIKAGEVLIPSMTFEDIEHIVFLFKEENKYDVLGYSDDSKTETYTYGQVNGFSASNTVGLNGVMAGSSETRTVYSIVFEIVKK